MRRLYTLIPATVLCIAAAGYRNHLSASTAVPTVGAERHPRIQAAIRELEAAKKELQQAPHDFGGHRADAVVAVDHAVEQLKLALRYDRK